MTNAIEQDVHFKVFLPSEEKMKLFLQAIAVIAENDSVNSSQEEECSFEASSSPAILREIIEVLSTILNKNPRKGSEYTVYQKN